MATIFWLDVFDLQPPFDAGVLDALGRAQWTFNIQALKHPSTTFSREIEAILVAAAVGTASGATPNIFRSAKAVIPAGNGPYLVINATGGIAGLRTHNVVSGPTYERPTAQITVRAASSEAAEGMARAAYAALMAVKNQTITVV